MTGNTTDPITQLNQVFQQALAQMAAVVTAETGFQSQMTVLKTESHSVNEEEAAP